MFRTRYAPSTKHSRHGRPASPTSVPSTGAGGNSNNAPSGVIIRIWPGRISILQSNVVFHPGPNTRLVSIPESVSLATTIGNMPLIRTSVAESIIAPVAISTGSIPGSLHSFPRHRFFGPFSPNFSFAAPNASDSAFPGLVPFNASSSFPLGRNVVISEANSCHEQFPVKHNNPFNSNPRVFNDSPNPFRIGSDASNPPIDCNTSEISRNRSACFDTQSLNASHFSSTQFGFSSNRFLACDLIAVTVACTSVLSVALIPAPLATSASNTVVARKCSAFAASNAAWAAANSDWAAVAVLAVTAFTPGTAAVATAVAAASFAVAAALTTFASHRL